MNLLLLNAEILIQR